MKSMQASVGTARRRLVAASACALALSCAPAVSASAATAVKPPASATVEQCVTSVGQLERSATFVGEMSAVPGTARMAMRIELVEHAAPEVGFHPVLSPGLGAWQRSSPGTKTFKSLDKVTDLAAPATYRADIHFRWYGAHNRLIKTLELKSPRCQQPLVPSPASEGTGGASH